MTIIEQIEVNHKRIEFWNDLISGISAYSSPSVLQPSILRPPLIIRPLHLVSKGNILC